MGWLASCKVDELLDLGTPFRFKLGQVDLIEPSQKGIILGKCAICGRQGRDLVRRQQGSARGQDKVHAHAQVGGFLEGQGDVIVDVGVVHHAGGGTDDTVCVSLADATGDFLAAAVIIGINDQADTFHIGLSVIAE